MIRTRVRMIDGDEVLVTLPHFPLGSKQIFGRRFISDERIVGDIPHPIDGMSQAVSAANQPAAFIGGPLASMCDDLIRLG